MKIKHYALLVVMGIFLHTATFGQTTNLYKMGFKVTGELLTVRGTTLAKEVPMTGENALAQSFIVQRLANGNVRIAGAGARVLFLKRSGDQVVLATHSDDPSYDWQLTYIGFPYLGLTEPSTQRFLGLDNGTLRLMNGAPLTDNTDPTGDTFRLTLTPVANTF